MQIKVPKAVGNKTIPFATVINYHFSKITRNYWQKDKALTILFATIHQLPFLDAKQAIMNKERGEIQAGRWTNRGPCICCKHIRCTRRWYKMKKLNETNYAFWDCMQMRAISHAHITGNTVHNSQHCNRQHCPQQATSTGNIVFNRQHCPQQATLPSMGNTVRNRQHCNRQHYLNRQHCP